MWTFPLRRSVQVQRRWACQRPPTTLAESRPRPPGLRALFNVVNVRHPKLTWSSCWPVSFSQDQLSSVGFRHLVPVLASFISSRPVPVRLRGFPTPGPRVGQCYFVKTWFLSGPSRLFPPEAVRFTSIPSDAYSVKGCPRAHLNVYRRHATHSTSSIISSSSCDHASSRPKSSKSESCPGVWFQLRVHHVDPSTPYICHTLALYHSFRLLLELVTSFVSTICWLGVGIRGFIGVGRV